MVDKIEQLSEDFIVYKFLGYRFIQADHIAKASLLGFAFYKKVGFRSILFGVPFYFGDIRWLPSQVNL